MTKKMLSFLAFFYGFIYAGIAFIDAVRASCEHGKPPTS